MTGRRAGQHASSKGMDWKKKAESTVNRSAMLVI